MRGRGTTVLFSTHVMPQAEELCDHICLINRGRAILQGRLDDLRAEHARRALRVRARHPLTRGRRCGDGARRRTTVRSWRRAAVLRRSGRLPPPSRFRGREKHCSRTSSSSVEADHDVVVGLPVLRREYLSRNHTKAFWISTALVPILLVAMMVLGLFMRRTGGDFRVAVDGGRRAGARSPSGRGACGGAHRPGPHDGDDRARRAGFDVAAAAPDLATMANKELVDRLATGDRHGTRGRVPVGQRHGSALASEPSRWSRRR